MGMRLILRLLPRSHHAPSGLDCGRISPALRTPAVESIIVLLPDAPQLAPNPPTPWLYKDMAGLTHFMGQEKHYLFSGFPLSPGRS